MSTSSNPFTGHALRCLTFAIVTTLLLSGCDLFDSNSDDDDPEPLTTAFSDEVITVPLFIEGADKQAPTDPNTPLYENRAHAPVVAPDGHHVTLGEFSTVRGTASVACYASGTRVMLHVSGLIPNGVYTFWNVIFKDPGFDPTMQNLTGIGVIGKSDGSESKVVASASGTASISAETSGGSLSMMGNIGSCPLTDNFEWHVVGAYHMDGQSHGPNLGPDGSAVEQFGFIFKR